MNQKTIYFFNNKFLNQVICFFIKLHQLIFLVITKTTPKTINFLHSTIKSMFVTILTFLLIILTLEYVKIKFLNVFLLIILSFFLLIGIFTWIIVSDKIIFSSNQTPRKENQ